MAGSWVCALNMQCSRLLTVWQKHLLSVKNLLARIKWLWCWGIIFFMALISRQRLQRQLSWIRALLSLAIRYIIPAALAWWSLMKTAKCFLWKKNRLNQNPIMLCRGCTSTIIRWWRLPGISNRLPGVSWRLPRLTMNI